MVNEAIRYSLAYNARGRKTMQPCYAQLRVTHPRVASIYAANARDDALAHLKVYRRRVRKGLTVKTPYRHRLAIRVDATALRLDVDAGTMTMPIGAGERIILHVALSQWHRRTLVDGKLGAAVITATQVILTVRRNAPEPYEPEGALALDTNEGSLDGVQVTDDAAILIQAPFPEVRVVQERHHERRRSLARKKAHDHRVKRRLLRGEGRRERNRVKQRLHRVSKVVVKHAQEHRLAIVLEDLHLPGGHTRSRSMNRRLSSWPRSVLHTQIAYKAEAAGVPLIKVNPRYTSKTCPACGRIQEGRGRVGRALFQCQNCPWSMDRQFNAGLNVLQRAIASNEAVARAVRFQPDALSHDAVKLLYHPRDVGARAKPRKEEPQPATAITPVAPGV